jgi:hypothetical protein
MDTSFVRHLTLAFACCLVFSGADPAHAQHGQTMILFDTAAPAFDRLGGELEVCGVLAVFGVKKPDGCFNTVAVVVASGHVDVRADAIDAAYRARYIDTELVFRARVLEVFNWPTIGFKFGVTTVDGFAPQVGAGLEVSKIVWLHDRVVVIPSLGIKAVPGMTHRVGMDVIPALRLNAGVRF